MEEENAGTVGLTNIRVCQLTSIGLANPSILHLIAIADRAKAEPLSASVSPMSRKSVQRPWRSPATRRQEERNPTRHT
jgi:hypothetical protein